MTESTGNFLKLLAFGDSLTEGFFNGGREFHPYSLKLEECIDKHFSEAGIPFTTLMHQFGMSGEYTSHMIPRLHEILEKARKQPYHFAIILGGTNDLALDDTGDEIFGRLKNLYEQVLDHNGGNSILVAVTIPQAYFLDVDYVTRRNVINDRIRKFCEECNTASPGKAILLDLERLLPYRDSAGIVDHEHWDDALHMSPDGYDQFGILIYEKIAERLVSVVS